MYEAIKTVIEQNIRPLIQKDGGDIELVDFNNGVVSIKFLGACVSCPYSFMTLKLGVLEILSEKFPEIKDVKAL
ncbi:MAG: NifU family protein [Candidatus Babeliaceae bacterium]|nr:NifU family protein [Candidatus Babeliaceae bacterium]